ncbi:hypothetical protein SO802_033157 [Lithocarpus litseifolius]|uniref:Uncharacterized protein n=1 Tax=Lithocarpus litseifolius TaxID=425828 RepID=A0AAW2BF22_9ROSI
MPQHYSRVAGKSCGRWRSPTKSKILFGAHVEKRSQPKPICADEESQQMQCVRNARCTRKTAHMLF